MVDEFKDGSVCTVLILSAFVLSILSLHFFHLLAQLAVEITLITSEIVSTLVLRMMQQSHLFFPPFSQLHFALTEKENVYPFDCELTLALTLRMG